MERIDTLNDHFKPVNKANKWSVIFFWTSVVFSFLVFFTDNNQLYNTVANIIFIMVSITYFIVSNWVGLFLLREAQDKRRDNFLSNALDVKLDDEHTELYYNNTQRKPLVRLGMNGFENTLFTWRVTAEMAKSERTKVIFYVLLFILITLINGININFISIIAQTIFTTGLIVNLIKLEILRSNCKQLFHDFRQVFLTNGANYSPELAAILLQLVFKYETTVASMGVHTSDTIFNKINPKVTEEWENVKKNLSIE